MLLKRELGKKGQVVIPKDIRQHFGLQPGSGVLFEVRGGEVVLRPEQDPVAFVEDFCAVGKKMKRPLTTRMMKKILEEEYEIS